MGDIRIMVTRSHACFASLRMLGLMCMVLLIGNPCWGQFPAEPLPMDSLDGNSGVLLERGSIGDLLGQAVTALGDVDGDGEPDYAVAAPQASPMGVHDAGMVFVIFGDHQSTTWPAALNLSHVDGTTVAAFVGEAGHATGTTLAGVGDVNGDGVNDIAMGSPYANAPDDTPLVGRVTVVFGRPRPWPPSLPLTALPTSDDHHGFVVNGPSRMYVAGFTLAGIGDHNGDSIDDMAMGTPLAHEGAGEVVVLYGRDATDAWPDVVNVSHTALNGARGFVVQGQATTDGVGHQVAGVGDVNCDGVADVAIAMRTGANQTGQVFFLWGDAVTPRPAIVRVPQEGGGDAAMGITVYGAQRGDNLAVAARANDVNGDLCDDVLLAAPSANRDGMTSTGVAYVLFGHNVLHQASPVVNVSAWADGVNGITLGGAGEPRAQLGYGVGSAGDVNQDGFGDVLIGAPGYADSAGRVWLLFGRASWPQPWVHMASVTYPTGATFSAAHGSRDFLGTSVAALGDVNGDGRDDVLLGAPRLASVAGESAPGKAMVVFGPRFTPAPTAQPTTAAPTATPTLPAPTTVAPTSAPTTSAPTATPTLGPTRAPTAAPTMGPTHAPVTPVPTQAPTQAPTASPVTPSPTQAPTQAPTASPVTPSPTQAPTSTPTASPGTAGPVTPAPTVHTAAPTTGVPTPGVPTPWTCRTVDFVQALQPSCVAGVLVVSSNVSIGVDAAVPVSSTLTSSVVVTGGASFTQYPGSTLEFLSDPATGVSTSITVEPSGCAWLQGDAVVTFVTDPGSSPNPLTLSLFRDTPCLQGRFAAIKGQAAFAGDRCVDFGVGEQVVSTQGVNVTFAVSRVCSGDGDGKGIPLWVLLAAVFGAVILVLALVALYLWIRRRQPQSTSAYIRKRMNIAIEY